MDHLADAVENAVKCENWYAALFVALALPDIAGWVDDPTAKVGVRYAAWFEKYVASDYRSNIGSPPKLHVFLSGADCYALRCSMLHQGLDDISGQRAKDALERFQFLAPRKGVHVHCNQAGKKLQLQVDDFCNDISAGVRAWRAAISNTDAVRLGRVAQLSTIQLDGMIRI